MINENKLQDFKSKTFQESITKSDKIMFHFKKPRQNKSSDKNKTDIFIQAKGKILSFTLYGKKFEDVTNSGYNIKKFKEQLLLLYSQIECKQKNFSNPYKESFIQLFSMDDEIEKNFKKKNTIYTLYNKSNTFNSNLLINNLKTQILKENELENIKIINENNEINNNKINPLEEKNYYEKSINTNNQLFKNYTQQICNICDFLKPSNKFILLENCNHTFCYNCAKNYYENLIEMGDVILKCPFYKCSVEIKNKEFLKNIISSHHYQRLLYGKCHNNDNKNNPIIIKGKTTMSSLNKGSIKKSTLNSTIGKGISKVELNSILKKYSKKNVLIVSHNEEELIIYTLFKDTVCPCCTLPCLFGKTLSNHLKCLNCLKRICKFCFKEVDTDHFNIYNDKCCKNYRLFLWKNKKSYRFDRKKLIKNCGNFGFIIISCLMTLIVMYVFLFLFIDYLFPHEKNTIKIRNNKTLYNFKSLTLSTAYFNKVEKKSKTFTIKYMTNLFFNIFLKIFLFWVPLLLFIILIPYFPLIHIIIENFICQNI